MFYSFFFSSRRRHTRSLRDWSSDVCSSDLWQNVVVTQGKVPEVLAEAAPDRIAFLHIDMNDAEAELGALRTRSEERRVGKECRSWRWTCQLKRKYVYS